MKILIVDDSRTSRSYIQKILLITGVAESDILQAKDGKIALETLATTQIAVLFLDINMPIIDGMEVVATIAAKNLMPCSNVVITSSLSDSARNETLQKHGVTYFLTKPFTPEALNSIYLLLRKK